MAKGWLNIGLETGIGWTAERIEVPFSGRVFIVHPFGADELPTVSIAYNDPSYPESPQLPKDPLGEPRCADLGEALELKERFLSALAWASNKGLSTHGHEDGGGHIYAAPAHWPRGTVDFGASFKYLPDPESPDARLALALYREALSVNSVRYQFLGFTNVLSITLTREGQKKWMNDHADEVSGHSAQSRVAALRAAGTRIGDYLYSERRNAIAHALGKKSAVNPDDPDHVERLREDVPLMQALARHFIETELGVNTPGKESGERSAQFLADRGTKPPSP